MPKVTRVKKVPCPPKRRTSVRTGLPVRWASIDELDRRTRVGSAAWRTLHPATRQKLLSAWRAMHAVAPHTRIRWYARRMGRGCSSNLTLGEMLAAMRRFHKSGYFHR